MHILRVYIWNKFSYITVAIVLLHRQFAITYIDLLTH
jgi:hypothetical protein